MSKPSSKTFRLAFVRKRINTIFKSRALKAALLAELDGGQDAALVVQMVEQVKAIVRPPTQAVVPMSQQNGEGASSVDPPTQAGASPQVQGTPSDGHTAATAVVISDSDSDSDSEQ